VLQTNLFKIERKVDKLTQENLRFVPESGLSREQLPLTGWQKSAAHAEAEDHGECPNDPPEGELERNARKLAMRFMSEKGC
jgi:hypothetical protein